MRYITSSTLTAILLLCTQGCTSKESLKPTPSQPVLKGISIENVSEIEVSMKPISDSAWRARVVREGYADWKLIERSDQPGVTDRADTEFISHFLKLLSTFSTETKADKGNDADLGFSPYRAEIRLKFPALDKTPEKMISLSLGNPTGAADIYFRTESSSATYIGKGAFVAFLGNMQTAQALQHKSPFLGKFEEHTGLGLEKLVGKDSGNWAFTRKNGEWAGITPEQGMLIERIFRQRINRIVTENLILPNRPDWVLRIDGDGKLAQPQEIQIYFSLDQVLAVNKLRGKTVMELYPEMAGALRAFTQAGFTPVKSRIK